MTPPLVKSTLSVGFATFAAAQQASSATSAADYNAQLSQQHPCNTIFSEDLYGLGVRLGYYFNWASGWTANNFMPDEIAGAQDSNSVFLLGLLASLLRGTSTRVLTRLDGIVLLELAAGTVWSVLSLWGYRTCVYRREHIHGISFFGGFGTHFRLLLSTILAGYSLWFFIVGVNADNPKHLKLSGNPDVCKRVQVLGLNLSGNGRYFGIVLCLLSLIYCGSMLITSSIGGITRLWKIGWLINHCQYSSSTRLRYISGFSHQHLVQLWQLLSLFNLLWIVFVITIVEVTIRENNIKAVQFYRDSDILTPSQLLPLIIGVLSFGRSVYYAFEHFRAGQGDIRPSLGLDSSIHSGVPVPRPTSIGGTIKWWMRLFSETLQDSSPQDVTDDRHTDVDSVREGWSNLQKARNAWLPWMSVLSFWPWDQGARAKRIEGFEDEQKWKEAPRGTSTGYQRAETQEH